MIIQLLNRLVMVVKQKYIKFRLLWEKNILLKYTELENKIDIQTI